MKIKKRILLKITTPLIFTILFTKVCLGTEEVNALTWWGYLDDPSVAAAVKENCNAN